MHKSPNLDKDLELINQYLYNTQVGIPIISTQTIDMEISKARSMLKHLMNKPS